MPLTCRRAVTKVHAACALSREVPLAPMSRFGPAPPTGLTVFAVAIDPQLGEIDTPNGRVTFVQPVGVTASEKQRMPDRSTDDVLGELAVANPLLITDPSRA